MNNNDLAVDVAMVGAGTVGTNAMKEIRQAGKSFVLIDHGPLGPTCARIGCMPSKAALHAGAAWQGYAAHRLAAHGEGATPFAHAGGVAAVLDVSHEVADSLTLVCENTLKKIRHMAVSALQTVPVSILAIARMQQDGRIHVRA